MLGNNLPPLTAPNVDVNARVDHSDRTEPSEDFALNNLFSQFSLSALRLNNST